MGPGDSYLVQHSRSCSSFWAEQRLALGNAFRSAGSVTSPSPLGPLEAAAFDAAVAEGFQASATWHQGRLRADAATAGPGPPSSVPDCAWAFSVTPRAGWGGGAAGKQRATAGWLAALPVFEPHWQVLVSHAEATGWVEWGGRRFAFTDAPFYSEKNWGGAFPRKWFWAQCNSWAEESAQGLALTSGGGVRDLPLLGAGRTEDVALIGLHVPSRLLPPWAVAAAGGDAEYTFIECVPWSGEVEWTVAPWGSWTIRGRNAHFEVALSASCGREEGTPLRAPTAHAGLAAVCRDTFSGQLTVAVWARGRSEGGQGKPLLRATSGCAALETGGGPWFETWSGKAAMSAPLRAALRLPVDVEAVAGLVAGGRRPPGL